MGPGVARGTEIRQRPRCQVLTSPSGNESEEVSAKALRQLEGDDPSREDHQRASSGESRELGGHAVGTSLEVRDATSTPTTGLITVPWQTPGSRRAGAAAPLEGFFEAPEASEHVEIYSAH